VSAWLVGGPAPSGGPDLCVSFWFSEIGSGGRGRTLTVKRQFSNGTFDVLWRFASSDEIADEEWTYAQFSLPSADEVTLVLFEGSVSASGGFALDDVKAVEDPAAACPSECLRQRHDEP